MKRFNPCANGTIEPDQPDEPAPTSKGRKEKVAVRKDRDDQIWTSVTRITLTINTERDLVELRFPSKPDEAVRAELKAARFRWYGPAGCWYHKHTPENKAWAEQFVARHTGASVSSAVLSSVTLAKEEVPASPCSSVVSSPVVPAVPALRPSRPVCVFCGRSGSGVQFAVFNPRFKPFGTACTACEAALPPGTTLPTAAAAPPCPVAPVAAPSVPAPTVAMTQASRAAAQVHALKDFIGQAQRRVLLANFKGEERQWFFDKVEALTKLIAAMPQTYEQDGKGNQAIAHLHYFAGGQANWYITEKDKGTPDNPSQRQAFGLADLFGDGGELGYISIPEILANGGELDFHFKPKNLAEIRGEAADAAESDDVEDNDADADADDESELVAKVSSPVVSSPVVPAASVPAWRRRILK